MLNPIRRWLGPWQRKLIFYPVPPSHLLYARLQPQGLTLEINGVRLQGWHRQTDAPAQTGALLYFGGNAEDVAHSLDYLALLPVRHVLAFNYRGYGLSEGTPSEAALYRDAETLQQQLLDRLDLAPQQLHLVGRSLGSAMATHVAARTNAASVSLLTPLQSIEAIARELFPWLPVSQFLADRFDLLANARNIDTPLLALIAGRDEVIPNAHSLTLFEEWKGPKRKVLIPQADHNNITLFPECHVALKEFIGGRGQ